MTINELKQVEAIAYRVMEQTSDALVKALCERLDTLDSQVKYLKQIIEVNNQKIPY